MREFKFDRRLFLVVSASAVAIALPPTVKAQPKERVFSIGFVSLAVPQAELAQGTHVFQNILRDGLRERGWVEGRNLRFHWKTAEGRPETLGARVEELLRVPVDLLILVGPGVTEGARLTRSTPIVAVGFDTALVESLSRPGRNITGVVARFDRSTEVSAKALQLFKEAAGVKRIAKVYPLRKIDPDFRFHPDLLASASTLGISLIGVMVTSVEDADAAITTALQQNADGFVVHTSPVWISNPGMWERVAHAIVKHRKPIMVDQPGAALDPGVVMGFGMGSFEDRLKRATYFVDRILRGAKPADLPIEQMQPRLVVNLKAAREIGLELPASFLLQADQVIE